MKKFKVGDRVRLTNDEYICYHASKGNTGIITAKDDNCDVIVLFDNNISGWGEDDQYLYVGIDSLELITPKEISNRILFAKVNPDAIIPSKRDEDGCYDLYICTSEDVVIQPHQIKLIPTGICSTFSSKYRIGIRERGSNTKSGLITVAGQIDSGFTGEWFLALYNTHDVPVCITRDVKEVIKTEDFVLIPYNKAQAQFSIEVIPQVKVQEVDLAYIKGLNTNRGENCLGSSGK